MPDQEQQGQQESARRAADAGRRAQQRAREGMEESRKQAEQLMSLGTETVTVWTDIQQRVARDVLQLSADGMQETARMFAEVQQAWLDGTQEGQSMLWRWQTMWPDAFRDPLHWYERAVGEFVENTRRGLRIGHTGLDAMSRAMERMQDTAGQAASTMQTNFREAAGRMQEVAHRVERLRAA